MKKILVLMMGFLLIGFNLSAADGDLIVEGNVGIGSNLTDPGARLQINTDVATTKGQIIKSSAFQSANLQEWQNSSGTVLAAVGSAGNMGVGQNASATSKLSVAGTGSLNNALSIFNTTNASLVKTCSKGQTCL